MSIEPTDVSLSSPDRRPEDTAAGCRLLASDDQARAEQSDSTHMRERLIGSAEAWSARAALLERLESKRPSFEPEAASGWGSHDG
jgi:hypothetical protein